MAELVHLLRAAVRGEVDDASRRRAEYSTDASNYRVVPRVVVFPRDTDDLLAVAEVARTTGAPLTLRGGGTSVAGNAIGPGIVVDTSKHLTAIGEIDPEARTAVVQPGVVMSDLQAAAEPYGLRFGPDPSTLDRATLGGMIGNNACGPHAVAYGRTADNVVSLDVVDGSGRRFTAGAGKAALEAVPGLGRLVTAHLPTVRTEFGRFGRQVSGYSLEHLLPERGSDLAKFLVGTEGSLVTVLGATVRLVPIADAAVLVVLGYPDMPAAADAVPALLAHDPLAVEGLDARLVDVVRRHRGEAHVPALPEGAGWLMVEMGGATRADALAAAEAMVADAGAVSARVVPPGPEAAALWRIRADGAGLGGRTPSGAQAWPGWEDAAVPPERLGAYLRDFDALMARHGVDGLPYGHFGDGCIHVRLDVPLERQADVPAFRAFMTEAADLVASYGGSLSGEHGDGRARSELLDRMYSAEAIALLGAVKHLFDPEDVLNPGVVVRPRPIDADLRRPHAAPLGRVAGGFSFAHDGGDLTRAVHRCVGVGKCRADTSAAGGFMCPSYLATRDEKDSTRGRARVLQEMANGSLVAGGVGSREVHEVLDLCLSCKACSSDCPAGVDMAQYKSEVLHRTYRGRLRPRTHYALGWLPRWVRLVGRLRLARVANAALAVRPVAKAVLALGGMDTRRGIPRFTTTTFGDWWRAQGASTHMNQGVGEGPARAASAAHATGGVDAARRVVLWTDSFSDGFDPEVPRAMITVLRDAGYEVIVPDRPACCGLTWISTGQLDGARARLTDLLAVLGPYAVNGIPIVGVEPSCTAVLRSDLLDLLPHDPRARAVAKATRTLAELLMSPSPDTGWSPPSLEGVRVLAQPHCHHHSVMGYDADRALLAATGAEVTTLAGCCGLAGNFGMEKGHYDVSVKVAEHALLPALRAAQDGTVLLADGFSCRTQAEDLASAPAVHLAQLLAGAIARR